MQLACLPHALFSANLELCGRLTFVILRLQFLCQEIVKRHHIGNRSQYTIRGFVIYVRISVLYNTPLTPCFKELWPIVNINSVYVTRIISFLFDGLSNVSDLYRNTAAQWLALLRIPEVLSSSLSLEAGIFSGLPQSLLQMPTVP
jgi:hypothetical protein